MLAWIPGGGEAMRRRPRSRGAAVAGEANTMRGGGQRNRAPNFADFRFPNTTAASPIEPPPSLGGHPVISAVGKHTRRATPLSRNFPATGRGADAADHGGAWDRRQVAIVSDPRASRRGRAVTGGYVHHSPGSCWRAVTPAIRHKHHPTLEIKLVCLRDLGGPVSQFPRILGADGFRLTAVHRLLGHESLPLW
jgi:hypothetical protein